MKFNNLLDLVQYFANEYTLPGSIVLCLGIYDPQIEKLFKFIENEQWSCIYVTRRLYSK